MGWLSTIKSLYLYFIQSVFLRHLNQLSKLTIQENSQKSEFLVSFGNSDDQATLGSHSCRAIIDCSREVAGSPCPPTVHSPATSHDLHNIYHSALFFFSSSGETFLYTLALSGVGRVKIDHAFYNHPVSFIYHQCVILFDPVLQPLSLFPMDWAVQYQFFFSFVPLRNTYLTNFYLYSYTLKLIARFFFPLNPI